MPYFIVNRNAQPTGEHEVHENTHTCNHLPEPENRIDLGFHNSCYEAIAAAKRLYPSHTFDGCYYCANACHTK